MSPSSAQLYCDRENLGYVEGSIGPGYSASRDDVSKRKSRLTAWLGPLRPTCPRAPFLLHRYSARPFPPVARLTSGNPWRRLGACKALTARACGGGGNHTN